MIQSRPSENFRYGYFHYLKYLLKIVSGIQKPGCDKLTISCHNKTDFTFNNIERVHNRTEVAACYLSNGKPHHSLIFS
jgi:hypothetical protein